MRRIPLLATALLATPAAAQVVWTVPTGQDLDPFIAQASPGDILLLGGNHPTFQLNKGLTIVGLGTDPVTGSYVSGFIGIGIDVPAGQTATLMGFQLQVWSATGQYTNALLVYGGRVTIADVVTNNSVGVFGEVVLQRVKITSGGLGIGGDVFATDVSVTGRSLAVTFTSILLPSAGVIVGGANTRFVGSRLTANGGAGGTTTWPTTQTYASRAGMEVLGGQVFLTDSTLAGVAGSPLLAASVALAGNGNVAIARTTLLEGAGATATSSGYQTVDTMVGMQALEQPTRGQSFAVTATAGSSQSLLGIVAGLDRTVNILPPVVEPVFGIPAQLIALTLAMPTAGATVPAAVAVPNLPTLLGVELWLQAVQLAGPTIRASTPVGGAIR